MKLCQKIDKYGSEIVCLLSSITFSIHINEISSELKQLDTNLSNYEAYVSRNRAHMEYTYTNIGDKRVFCMYSQLCYSIDVDMQL